MPSMTRSVRISARLLLIGLLVVGCIGLPKALNAAPDQTAKRLAAIPHRPGELIVKLKEGAALQDVAPLLAAHSAAAPAGAARAARLVFHENETPERQLEDLYAWQGELQRAQANGGSLFTDSLRKERLRLEQEIEAAEELRTRLSLRAKRAPREAASPRLDKVFVVTLAASDIEAALTAFLADPAVEYAEPNGLVSLTAFPDTLPNDDYVDPDQNGTWTAGALAPGLKDLWGVERIQAHLAWKTSQGTGVLVAIADTGINYNHPELSGRMAANKGYDFINNDANPMDDHYHGTHVAGTVAAQGNNSEGIIGVAPQAKLMAVKVLNQNGEGSWATVAAGVRWAADNGADIINFSLGGAGPSSVLEEAFLYARSKGVVSIAAAGNDYADAAGTIPGAYASVIGVGALDAADHRADFSNYGATVDVAAPGTSILSTAFQGGSFGYRGLGGTSMASPHVAGVAALILARNSALTVDQVATILRQSVDPVTTDQPLGSGRINALKAVTNTTPGAPILEMIGDKSVAAGSLLEIQLQAADPAGKTVTYSMANKPAGAALNAATGLFTWTPTADQIGRHPVTFTASNGNASDSEDLTITVNAPNQPPVLAAIGNKTIAAGFSLSFNASATDPNNDTLTYSITGKPAGASFTASNGYFNWTPTHAQTGSYQVTFGVSDGKGGSDSETVTITATSSNHPPVLASIGDKTVQAGGRLLFTISATDQDSDPMTASIANKPAGASFNNSTGQFSWTPTAAQVGSSQVTFTVTDSKDTRDSETITITVTAAGPNNPPVLDAIGDKSVQAGKNLTFTINASDADSDPMTAAISGKPNGATFNTTTGQFSWTPTAVQAGSHQVTFTVSDNKGGSDTETITITVTAGSTNNPPVLAAIGDKSVQAGLTLTFTISASDPDSDPMTASVSGKPSGASFNTSTGQFNWMPAAAQVGSHQVTFTVSDNRGGSDSETIAITVTSGSANNPPVLAAIGNKTVQAGQSLSFTISASDPDSDPMTASITNKPSGAAFNTTTGLFSWTPATGQAGSHAVTFTVRDSKGASDSETITITVTSENANNPPVLDPIGNKTVQAGRQLSFTISGTDPDSDPMSASIGAKPSGASFNTTSGQFSWTPAAAQIGDHRVTFTITDSKGASDSETIAITVTSGSTNNPPILNPIGNKTVQAGKTLTFSIGASDPDADPMTAAVSGKPSGASFNTATGQFVWTPTTAQVGNHAVIFTVSDNKGGSDSETISISVTSGSANNPPVLTPIGNKTVEAGLPLVFTISASDPDSDPMTAAVSAKPAGAAFNNRTGEFSWTPAAGQAGTHHVTFTVSDDKNASDSETIAITVTSATSENHPPVLATIGRQQVRAGEVLKIQLRAEDQDADVMYVSAAPLPSGAAFSTSTGMFEWRPAEKDRGSHTLTFTVTDEHGAVDAETVVISVISAAEMERRLIEEVRAYYGGTLPAGYELQSIQALTEAPTGAAQAASAYEVTFKETREAKVNLAQFTLVEDNFGSVQRLYVQRHLLQQLTKGVLKRSQQLSFWPPAAGQRLGSQLSREVTVYEGKSGAIRKRSRWEYHENNQLRLKLSYSAHGKNTGLPHEITKTWDTAGSGERLIERLWKRKGGTFYLWKTVEKLLREKRALVTIYNPDGSVAQQQWQGREAK